MDGLVGAKKLAEILDVDPKTIYNLRKSGKITSYKVGYLRRFDPEEVIAELKGEKPKEVQGEQRGEGEGVHDHTEHS